MGNEVNLNPFGYDNYKDLKKEIGRTKDEDGKRLSSSRSDAASESIFNKDEKEVTKDDFLDRLEEIGLDDDAASAMWEILNIDSNDVSEDILDSSEIDKLIQMYGDDIDSDTDWDAKSDSVSIKSFLKYVGDEKEVKESTSLNDVAITPTTADVQNSAVNLNELDNEKYSSDKINKDKDEILSNKSEMDKALAKIKSGEEKPSSDWGNGLIYYNIALSNGKRAYVRYENGSIISCDLVKLDRGGNETHLSRSTFDSEGNMDALYLDNNKSGKSEKTASFNKDGSLSSINYDSNENGSIEASAKFENGNFKSILTSSSDDGKFDKEFTAGENSQYENGYKLDANGNRIVEQPKVEEQVAQETAKATPEASSTTNKSSATKPKENLEISSNKGDRNLTDLKRKEREDIENAKKEVIAKGKASLDENGNTEYIVYKNKVYNPDGSASNLMQLSNDGKIISKKEAQIQ